MSRHSQFRYRLLHVGLALAAGNACAAGHFDVSDADTLQPGRCQYEVWAGRAEAASAGFQHLAPACRFGPVELGLNLDQSAGSDARARYAGPVIKWTWYGQPDDPLRAAIAFAAAWDLHNHGTLGRQVLLPVTWQPLSSLMLHANLGADWMAAGGVRALRRGVAAEWSVDERVSLIVERNRALGAWTTRGGLRFRLTPMLALDVSAARMRPGGAVFTVGLNHEFGR